MIIIYTILTLLQLMILVVGLIPGLVICCYFEYKIIPIIVIVYLVIYLCKKNKAYLIKDVLLLHILCLISYFSSNLSPGVDDSFSTLSQAIDATTLFSFFSILTAFQFFRLIKMLHL